jgi:hypothetical protein
VSLLLSGIIRHRLLALGRAALLLGALALGGCSALKLGYEQSPALLYWWLDSHVDFSDAQTPRAREALGQLQAWHRAQELPAYAALFAQWATLAEAPVSEAQTCQATQQVQLHLARLADTSARLAAPIVQTMDERQRQHLVRYWARKNKDWAQEWLQGPAEQRLQRRGDKTIERYADFYGTLSPAQMALVRQQVAQSAWTPEWGQQERLRRQKVVLEALQPLEHTDASEARLRSIWGQVMNPPAPADRERLQGWLDQGCKDLAELHNSTSAEQRQRAVRRLRAYEKDLRELAGRSS